MRNHCCVELYIEPRSSLSHIELYFTPKTTILLSRLNQNQELERSINGIGDYKSVSEDAIKDASKKAHVTTNEQLHETDFDDTLSGTTAISILLKVKHS